MADKKHRKRSVRMILPVSKSKQAPIPLSFSPVDELALSLPSTSTNAAVPVVNSTQPITDSPVSHRTRLRKQASKKNNTGKLTNFMREVGRVITPKRPSFPFLTPKKK